MPYLLNLIGLCSAAFGLNIDNFRNIRPGVYKMVAPDTALESHMVENRLQIGKGDILVPRTAEDIQEQFLVLSHALYFRSVQDWGVGWPSASGVSLETFSSSLFTPLT